MLPPFFSWVDSFEAHFRMIFKRLYNITGHCRRGSVSWIIFLSSPFHSYSLFHCPSHYIPISTDSAQHCLRLYSWVKSCDSHLPQCAHVGGTFYIVFQTCLTLQTPTNK